MHTTERLTRTSLAILVTRPLNDSLGTDLEAAETVLLDAGELVGSNAPGSSSRVWGSTGTLQPSRDRYNLLVILGQLVTLYQRVSEKICCISDVSGTSS